jgi:3-hydroxyacyl-[acyl-carrier-protein] dehydratase
LSKASVALLIAADHPAFAGHFPDMPILPGVVLLDEALHAIGNAVDIDLGSCQIDSVKFLNACKPAEPLSVEFERLDNGAIRFDIMSEECRIATGSVRAAASGQ